MKVLDGKELAGFIKERQRHQVAGLSKKPHLLIIRNSDSPVIAKYVHLKMEYGDDIGIKVSLFDAKDSEEIRSKILEANGDKTIDGMILQLPIADKDKTDELTDLIASEKDVDGLSNHSVFDSATATAINWLLAGHSIELNNKKIALVGHGKLVGAPLEKMFKNSGYDVTVFHRGDDLNVLSNYNVIISATGVPELIKSEMVQSGAVVVDAGTASEGGVIVGDVEEAIRHRTDLTALTPKTGGVGPLTVTCLFDHVIQAAIKNQ